MTSIAVCIGRFQPFHNGHLAALQEALDTSDQVIVAVGSAFRARTPKNPFTWQERHDMIRLGFSEESNQRLHIVPLRDYFDVERWSRAVCQQLSELTAMLSDGSRSEIRVCGDWRHFSLKNGGLASGWQILPSSRHGEIDGSKIRDNLFQAILRDSKNEIESGNFTRALEAVSSDVPLAVVRWLQENVKPTLWSYLAGEWQVLQRIRQSWQVAPFPPTFTTVDAVVRCSQRVLLIRRGGSPGCGLLALPGGFVEQSETVEEAAMRELSEETHIGVSRQTLRSSLVDKRVFDHPHRSLFGRVITHGHFFDLETSLLPCVQADDDARNAQWVPISDLPSMEDQFHDDHFFILDHFLKLLHSEMHSVHSGT